MPPPSVAREAEALLLRQAFAAFDTDGSGALTTAQLDAILTRPTSGLPMSTADVTEILKAADAQGVGGVPIEELIILLLSEAALSRVIALDRVSKYFLRNTRHTTHGGHGHARARVHVGHDTDGAPRHTVHDRQHPPQHGTGIHEEVAHTFVPRHKHRVDI